MFQKYVIIHFLDVAHAPTDFKAGAWPLHITLLANFTLAGSLEDFSRELAEYASGVQIFQATAGETAHFGPTGRVSVTLLSEVSKFFQLHKDLGEIAARFGPKYDEPQYMLSNYRPHATIQPKARLQQGDKVTIDSLTLVDMLPDGDFQKRRILQTFQLQ